MRALAFAAVLLAGCYDPTFTEGVPCAPGRRCPEGQYCVEGRDVCSGIAPDPATFEIISAGAHTCAITFEEHKLYCWGDNRDGELGDGSRIARPLATRVADDDATWKSVAAGDSYTIAVKTNGTLWGWGEPSYVNGVPGSITPEQIDDGTDWQSVVAGDGGWCARDGDGALLCKQSGMLQDDVGTGWDQITTSGGHTCGLKGTDLYCWGDNLAGQCGVDSADAVIEDPLQIEPSISWKAVAAGTAHTCAATTGGDLYCWGANTEGQVAQPLDQDRYEAPTQVPIVIQPAAEIGFVTSYGNTTCAVDDGTLNGGLAWCFGAGYLGQIGDGVADPIVAIPRQVNAISFLAFSMGQDHACGIDFQSGTWCWGADTEGQLGDDEIGREPKPRQLDVPTRWASVAVGERTTCAIDEDGRGWCWGANGHGQVGDLSTLRRGVPSPLFDRDGTKWTKLSVGLDHTCGLRENKTLWCWGANTHSQLGVDGTIDALEPNQVTDETWLDVAAGDFGTCAIHEDGKELWCWGDARGTRPAKIVEGEWSWIGHSQAHEMVGITEGAAMKWRLTDPAEPVPLDGEPTNWKSVWKSGTHACGLTTQDDLECVGDNNFGELGDGTTNSSVTPVSPTTNTGFTVVGVGDKFSCGLSDKDLYCWGWNAFGQTGNDDISGMGPIEPLHIEEQVTFRDLSVGGATACAIRDDDQAIWCWGVSQLSAAGTDSPEFVIKP